MTLSGYIPTEEFGDVSAQFNRILADYAPSHYNEGWFAGSHGDLANELDNGGWFDVGGSGDEKTSIVDLLEMAEIWGRYLVPLPYSQTLLLRRLRAVQEVAHHNQLRTVSLSASRGGGQVPYGNVDGATFVSDVSGTAEAQRRIATTWVDDFCHSMPIVGTSIVTSGPEGWLQETIALLGAEAVGAARCAMEQALRYTHDRQVYGQVIGIFQAVRHLAANMYKDLEYAKSACLWAAGASSAPEALRAVVVAAGLSRSVVEKAIQIHGGIGFTWDLDVHWYLRRTMAVEGVVRTM